MYLPLLQKLQKHLGNVRYANYIQNQQSRDNYTHHTTIINPITFLKH